MHPLWHNSKIVKLLYVHQQNVKKYFQALDGQEFVFQLLKLLWQLIWHDTKELGEKSHHKHWNCHLVFLITLRRLIRLHECSIIHRWMLIKTLKNHLLNHKFAIIKGSHASNSLTVSNITDVCQSSATGIRPCNLSDALSEFVDFLLLGLRWVGHHQKELVNDAPV